MLSKICDKIVSYNKTLELHGYVSNGTGIKPWSHRATLGTFHIDTRGSDWTAYEGDREVCSGVDPASLAQYLNGDYKNGASI